MPTGLGGDTFPLTRVQVCHAVVTVARNCAITVAGLGFPEGRPRARWPVATHLVSPPLLVQEAAGHELHTLLLTLLVCGTGRPFCVTPASRPHAPPTEYRPVPLAQFLPGQEGGQGVGLPRGAGRAGLLD